MSSEGTSVPDLLRRFAPAPHVCNLFVDDAYVRLETNDPSIVTAMRSAAANSSNENGKAPYFWKLIRDDEAPCSEREITILSSGALNTLLLGAGTTIVIDRQQREVLGFIAPDVSARELVTLLLPLITKLSREPHPAIESAISR